jgi:hypothetical protein
VGSPPAEYLLTIRAVFLVCLSIWLCWRLAVALGAARGARIAAVAVAAFAPLYIAIELRSANRDHLTSVFTDSLRSSGMR